MSLKQEVLANLEAAQGRDLSGQELAHKLGVSRNAIWKAIQSLRQEGYQISSATNRGYCLKEENDLLSAEVIRAALAPGYQDTKILLYKEIDSTNNEAKRLLSQYPGEKLLLLADQQSQGRGRQGRSFFSPARSGLYMSLVIHPQSQLSNALSITTMSSVAVARAIRQLTGLEAQIKWVNDLYLHGRKICGILTEAVSDFETGTLQSLVIGIGVNLSTEFPEELAKVGGSLEVAGLRRNALAAEIVNQLLPLAADLSDHSYLEDYRRYSLVLGKQINYFVRGEAHPATALAIDEDGGLLVRLENGEEMTLSSGEISIRLAE